MSVLTSKNYKSLESYSALDDYQGDRDEIVPCCLDGLLEEEKEEIDFNTADDLLRISDAKHSYLSPTTKRLHNELLEASGGTNYNEESITASKKNMIANVNWIMTHGDAMNNRKCAEIISDLEKSIMAAKLKIQREVFVTPTKMGLSFPAFAGKKPRNLQKRYKGIAG
jgi:hypothetical protein